MDLIGKKDKISFAIIDEIWRKCYLMDHVVCNGRLTKDQKKMQIFCMKQQIIYLMNIKNKNYIF